MAYALGGVLPFVLADRLNYLELPEG
jgi:hypothetical protein